MSIFVIENVCKTRCHSIGDPKGIFINILSRYATKTRIAIYFVQPWPSFSVITFFQFLNISIYPSYLYLTPNTWAILPSLTWSKWNMVEICGLKFHLSYVDMPQFIFGNSSMRTPCHFYYWICTFDQNNFAQPSFCIFKWCGKSQRNWALATLNFCRIGLRTKKIFFLISFSNAIHLFWKDVKPILKSCKW